MWTCILGSYKDMYVCLYKVLKQKWCHFTLMKLGRRWGWPARWRFWATTGGPSVLWQQWFWHGARQEPSPSTHKQQQQPQQFHNQGKEFVPKCKFLQNLFWQWMPAAIIWNCLILPLDGNISISAKIIIFYNLTLREKKCYLMKEAKVVKC